MEGNPGEVFGDVSVDLRVDGVVGADDVVGGGYRCCWRRKGLAGAMDEAYPLT